MNPDDLIAGLHLWRKINGVQYTVVQPAFTNPVTQRRMIVLHNHDLGNTSVMPVEFLDEMTTQGPKFAKGDVVSNSHERRTIARVLGWSRDANGAFVHGIGCWSYLYEKGGFDFETSLVPVLSAKFSKGDLVQHATKSGVFVYSGRPPRQDDAMACYNITTGDLHYLKPADLTKVGGIFQEDDDE